VINVRTVRQRCCRVLVAEAVDWDLVTTPAVWDLLQNEGVGACIWWQLCVLDGEHAPAVPRIRALIRAQAVDGLRMRSQAACVLRTLATANIPCLILRGQALAKTLYPSSSLRPQTDIDLLVPEGSGDNVTEVLMRAGWQSLPSHSLLFERRGILLDVHVEPLGIERIHSWAHLTPLRSGDFFAHAVGGKIAGIDALLVKDRVLLPYLCFHAMKHSFDRLIWLWDIALLARRVEKRGQWRQVEAGIEDYRLERPAFYALSFVQRHLKAPVPMHLLQTIRPVMGRRERRLYDAFLAHEQIPFLAERVFARMQPDLLHRLGFWWETFFPRREVRRQVREEGNATGFVGKRLGQIALGLGCLWRQLKSAWFRPG